MGDRETKPHPLHMLNPLGPSLTEKRITYLTLYPARLFW